MSSEEARLQACRLCGGSVSKVFSLRVLQKYDVDYLACHSCKSLQTVEPFWLTETYGSGLPNLDDGAARRSLRSCSLVLLVSTVLRLDRRSRVLDFGGGDGFVCRLLRDTGFNAYVHDKYVSNFYAHGFSGRPDETYDIVCAFEVLEHLATPNLELSLIFASRPKIVILSTDRYEGQGSDWAYLGPEQGGHVFFYSDTAMKLIASRFGYQVLSRDSSAVFFRGLMSRRQRAMLAFAIRPIGLLLGRIWLQFIRPRRMADEAWRGNILPGDSTVAPDFQMIDPTGRH